MNRNTNPMRISRSGLLLTETLIAILFFSIASAVCLQLFGKTHSISQRSHLLELAITQSGSVADLLNASPPPEGNIEAICSLLDDYYPQVGTEENAALLYYDRNFDPCEKDEACYFLAIHPSDTDMLIDYSLEMYLMESESTDSEPVYRLNVSIYSPYEKSAAEANLSTEDKEET